MVATLLASGRTNTEVIFQSSLIASGGSFLMVFDGVSQTKLQQYAIVNVATRLPDTGAAPIYFEKWDCWLPFSYVGFGGGNTNLTFFIKFFKRDLDWYLYRIT